MDPNPKSFPILSYVMSKIPSMGPRHTAGTEFDIENPQSDAAKEKEPAFDLTERMPKLTDPKLIASMRAAVSEVNQARSVLKTLGERPDHETIDAAKAKLVEIDDELSKELEEIVLTPRPEEVDRIEWRAKLVGKEMERRTAAEQERQFYKTVISLDEMHEAYGKMLSDAETKLEKIYAAAVAGRDLAEEEGSSGEAAEEVNEEVVGILQEASGRGIERIDLSGRMLRLIPEAFGHLQGLIALNLSSNQLESIPDSIGGLENIEELNLASNPIQSLPDTIGLLLKLKFLDVSGNKLTALPDSICQCRSLLELDASFNKLNYLPTNIGFELVNLRRLSVQLNKIRSLPTSIGEMRSLSILDVHFNELHGLPATIGRLTNLETLDLSGNFSDMRELPETFGDLISLKELDLSNNQIHALPDSFGRLENLVKLNLEENPLVIPPKEIVARGVEAVKIFMAKRWLDILVEEDRKSALEATEQQMPTGWLTRSTSWLNTVATGVSGYLGNVEKSPADPYLNQQL